MIPRLYIPDSLQKSARIQLSDAQMHYLRDVLRCREGNALKLFNGKDGEWAANLISLHKKFAAAEVGEQLRPQKNVPDIALCFAPIKHARLDTMIEKASELGVSAMTPVMTKFTQPSRVNVDRLRANAMEAAEQCERLDVPVVSEPIDFPKWLAGFPKDRLLLYGDESGNSPVIGELKLQLPVSLLIGPEGGFSKEEHALLKASSFVRGFCMGPRILRADTAAIAALACIFSAVGDWSEKPRFAVG